MRDSRMNNQHTAHPAGCRRLKGALAQALPAITREQVRAARGLLGWSTGRLASVSEIPGQSVQRFETTGRVDPPGLSFPQIDRLLAIRSALEAAGVEFTNEDAPGVRLQGVCSNLEPARAI